MIQPPSHPTRLLFWLAIFARWSLRLLLAFWLLLAVALGVLNGWIVPRISEYRPQLESLAARALGIPVQIGAITARSKGLMPVIELHRVQLQGAQGQLQQLVLAVSMRSLLRLGVEQLYIEGPQLEVRRDAAGQLWIAGLALPRASEGSSPVADWLLSQTEVVIRSGQLRWVDELRQAPPLQLQNLDLVLRNQGRRHALRLNATPEENWGARFSFIAKMHESLLRGHASDWQRWSGQAYAYFPELNVANLGQYIDLQDVKISAAHGALRSWADIRRGKIEQLTTDLALNTAQAQLRPDLQPLALTRLQGRLRIQQLPGHYAINAQALSFETGDGLHWPASDFSLRHTDAAAAAVASGEQNELRVEQLDLAIAAELAKRLPLSADVHQTWRTLAPRGQVKTLHAVWRGPQQYQVSAAVEGLAFAAQPAPQGPGIPGVQGLNAQFSFNQRSGSAELNMQGGTLHLPGVFEDPFLPLAHLRTKLRWQLDGEKIAVQAQDLRFANADAQGTAQASWHSGSSAASRFPGFLTLSGSLSNADGSRVHRYLPLTLPADARHYVRDSVRAGRASQVQFKVHGDLDKLPFEQPDQGIFEITAKLHGVHYDYVPAALQSAREKPWPALTDLSGELAFESAAMTVRNAQARIATYPQLQLQKIQADIADLNQPQVKVQAQAQGELAAMFGFVATSPVSELTEHLLDQAQASGKADLQLQLNLPIEQLEQTKVQGSVALQGNSLRLMPEVPVLRQMRGAVQFSDAGFSLSGLQAQALGGPVRFAGGLQLDAAALASQSPITLRATGTASAQGLREAAELGPLAQIARAAQGQADYALELGLRRGTPAITVTSNLQGLALDLPSPVGKPAATLLPLRFSQQLAARTQADDTLHDEITLQWGELGHLRYLRDTSSHPAQVLSGALTIGSIPSASPAAKSAPEAKLPPHGVHAQIHLATLDIDAWQAALQRLAPAASAADASSATAQSYLPHTIALSVQTLTAQGRTVHALSANSTRRANLWQAQIDARELSGHIEYRTGQADEPAGQIYARLKRLTIAQSTASEVNPLLSPQPQRLPALDIAVDALELFGRPLGRFEIQASNRETGLNRREWQLAKFNITTAEARLQASGSWALEPGKLARTALRFVLDIDDTGQLLSRFSMPGVVRKGRGKLEGQIAWNGSVLAPDYRSLNGQIQLDMAAGQFLKAEPGLAKLLGVLNLQALPRRLTLDFRDIFSQGFAFDFVRGNLQIEQGIAHTNNLQMKGVNAAVLLQGQADILHETQNLHVVVVPEINAGTAALVATAINPVVGLSSFLAQMLLRGPLIAAATKEFRIDGSWSDPQVHAVPSAARRAPTAAAQTSSGEAQP